MSEKSEVERIADPAGNEAGFLDGLAIRPTEKPTPAVAPPAGGLRGPHAAIHRRPIEGPAAAGGASGNAPVEVADESAEDRHGGNSVAEKGFQLEGRKLAKTYRKGNVQIPVLRAVDIRVRRGEFLAIVGQSGSGKSTLLHLLGTLDVPDQGSVIFKGQRIDNLPARRRDAFRNQSLGMIFQFYHLLPELTTLENVLAPLMIGQSVWTYLGKSPQYKERALDLLKLVGLGHRLKHKPRELSGGEMQRAAIARALVTGPELLLADEPTGNLDRDNGREILEILGSLNRRQKLTIVMVTHDQAIAARADRTVRLVNGQVEAA
jgi:lipoprotein-releasing system ATP-binding protein